MNLANYSNLKHLCDGLFLKSSTRLAMLTPLAFYGDASGTKRDDLLVVGGFIAPVSEWLLFETEWNLVLRENGVRYFHMKEFAHSVGEYQDGWRDNEERRRQLLDRLIGVLSHRAEFCVGTCILRRVYDEVDSIYRLHEELFPYPLAGITCVDQILEWKGRRHEDDPIEFFFAQGDDDHGQLINAVKQLTGEEPVFRDARKIPPLQAADFTAYEQYRAMKSVEVELDRLFEKWRVSFDRLFRAVPSWHGTYDDVTSLRVVCRQMNIQKR